MIGFEGSSFGHDTTSVLKLIEVLFLFRDGYLVIDGANETC